MSKTRLYLFGRRDHRWVERVPESASLTVEFVLERHPNRSGRSCAGAGLSTTRAVLVISNHSEAFLPEVRRDERHASF